MGNFGDQAKYKLVLDLSLEEWQNYLQKNGFERYRANQIFNWFHNKLEFDLKKISNLPENVKAKIGCDFVFPPLKPEKELISKIDSTRKFIFDFNGKKIESLFLPFENRNSVCISVSAGCALDCSFCASGKIKYAGNLSCGEIISQVYLVQKITGKKISNVVFMGMGEPFYNYENSLKASAMLSDENGQNISNRRITLSTAGVLPGIKNFVNNQEPYNLALSVHSVDKKIRSSLMDIENKFSIEDIFEFLEQNRNKLKKNQLTFEYTMIKNVNMSKNDAKKLAAKANRLRAKINLIPLNTEFHSMERPDQTDIDEFWQVLNERGALAFNRASPGHDIQGACGMLSFDGITHP